MTDEYGIRKDVDKDYIDVETRRADVTVSEDEVSEYDDDIAYRFDVADGSGASSGVEEMIDQNAVIEHDGRASTRTFFYMEEVPETNREQFKRMLGYQEDKWSGMKNQQRKADRMRKVHGFCSKLDMTSYQKQRVKHIESDINMKHMASFSSDKVILGIVSIVANEDNRFIRDESDFRDILVDVGSDLDEMKSIRSLIRDMTDYV